MPTFTPPTDLYVPPILPETKGVQFRLFRHYERRARGVNVFILSDGTVVQDLSTPGFAAGTVPYPWNPDNPGGPYATSYSEGVVTNFSLNPYIKSVFWGGHSTVISSADATTLTTAGYGAYIT